jgi:hypothetical protein
MKFETKYNFGDVVFHSTTSRREIREVCPECNGEKAFHIVGKDFKAACRHCRYSGYGQPTGYVSRWELTPSYDRLTIGQIRIESTDTPGVPGSEYDNYRPHKKHVEQYMCIESGVGCGSLYYVETLFNTPEEALEHGKILVAQQIQREAEEAEERRRRQSEYAEVAESDEA